MVITDRVNNCHDSTLPSGNLPTKSASDSVWPRGQHEQAKQHVCADRYVSIPFISDSFRFYCKGMDEAITSGDYLKYNQVLTLSCVLPSLCRISNSLQS